MPPTKTSQQLFQSARSTLLFGIFTASFVFLVVATSAVFLLVSRPHAAVMTLGVGSCLLSAFRGVGPPDPWFASRNRVLDLLIYAAVGVGLLTLSSWVYASPA